MPKFTTKNINRFLAFKLPSAYFSGIRVTEISDTKACAKVRHRWINQNPFKSLFWAVQAMAAELVTGILLMKKIKDSNQRISMLVINQNGSFSKKATGRITFQCDEGNLIDQVLKQAIETGEGHTIVLKASGVDEENDIVSSFEFTWSIKSKK